MMAADLPPRSEPTVIPPFVGIVSFALTHFGLWFEEGTKRTGFVII